MAGPVPSAIAEEKSSLPTTSAAQQAGAAQGVDVISDLIRQASDADAAAMTAAKAASVPVSAGHVAPQAVMLPGGGQPHEQLAMDTNPVVGHRQALQRGIANATRGVANLVSAVSTQVEQKQTQRLAVNMERLMTATQSMDQAKQVLSQDPNNSTAQDQLKRSGAIMDEILSDDKTRKSIQKAYNINFTDPSKNNTKEHAALKMATDSYGQQFQKQLPQQMAPNQAAIEQAKLAQAQAVATHKTIDAIIPAILRQQGTLGAAEIRAKAAGETEHSKELAAIKLQHQKAADAYRTALARQKLANAGHLAAVLVAQRHADARNEAKIKETLDKSGGDPSKIPFKDLQANINALNKEITDYPKTYSQLVKARDLVKKDMDAKGPKSRFTAESLQQHNDMLYYEEQQNKANEETRKFFQNELNRRESGGKLGEYESQPNADSTPAAATGTATLSDVDPDSDTSEE